MERYFDLMTFIKFGLPLILFGLVAIFVVFTMLKGARKSRLMKKLGYTYDPGLGIRVDYEFQPHWVKGLVRINCRVINNTPYSRITELTASKEASYKDK